MPNLEVEIISDEMTTHVPSPYIELINKRLTGAIRNLIKRRKLKLGQHRRVGLIFRGKGIFRAMLRSVISLSSKPNSFVFQGIIFVTDMPAQFKQHLRSQLVNGFEATVIVRQR